MGRYDDIIELPRPESKHPKMPLSDRAKLFAPFAALRGYDDAVSDRRNVYTERILLSDDAAEELNRTVTALRSGDITEAVYFKKLMTSGDTEYGVYETVAGEFGGIDTIQGLLFIGGKTIKTEDIIKIHSGV